jgi:hypothetical protein
MFQLLVVEKEERKFFTFQFLKVKKTKKKVIKNFKKRKAFWWPDPSHQKL